jgi:hypothetical protein
VQQSNPLSVKEVFVGCEQTLFQLFSDASAAAYQIPFGHLKSDALVIAPSVNRLN